MELDTLAVDRREFAVGCLGDGDDMLAYSLSRSVGERLEAIELLRRELSTC